MNRTSPPAPVTARPVATPGIAVRSAASWKKRCRPRASRTAVDVDRHRRLDLAGGELRRRLAQHGAELALEPAHARLAGVLGDERPQRVVVDRDLVLAQAVAVALARPQVALGDRDLLVGRVAVEAHDLHAVEQRPGDRLGDVRRRDEHDLGQVQLDVEVVVAERVVLRRVEHLEQRRARVAAPVGADLVDLVEQDHRVHRAGVAQGTHQPARQRADVGAPVAADLGLVAHAAERHAHELAAGRAGDRLADRGLAGAGRADQREDRAGALVLADAALLAQLAHGDVLDDAVLDVLEAGVVGVQHLTRVHRVEALVGALLPRHGDQPVEVGADHRALARLLAHALEAGQLALGLLAHVVRHAGFLDLRAVLVDDRGVVLAELLADRLHLLAQEVLALLLLGAGLDVVADAPAHLQLGQPLALHRERLLEPLGHVERLQQLDLLLVAEVGRVAGGVRQRARLADRAQEGGDAAVVAAQLEDLLDHGAVLALEVAGRAVDGLVVGVRGDLDAQVAARVGLSRADRGAVQAVQRDGATAAGQAHPLDDLGHGADARERVLGARHEHHTLLVADVDGERDGHVREDDRVVDRDQQQSFSHRFSAPYVS